MNECIAAQFLGLCILYVDQRVDGVAEAVMSSSIRRVRRRLWDDIRAASQTYCWHDRATWQQSRRPTCRHVRGVLSGERLYLSVLSYVGIEFVHHALADVHVNVSQFCSPLIAR